jgi:hypothetical protein
LAAEVKHDRGLINFDQPIKHEPKKYQHIWIGDRGSAAGGKNGGEAVAMMRDRSTGVS